MFVLILQLPLSFLVGPKIFLSIFLSNTESLCVILSLKTHVSQPCGSYTPLIFNVQQLYTPIFVI
jgi:hypothetical protein